MKLLLIIVILLSSCSKNESKKEIDTLDKIVENKPLDKEQSIRRRIIENQMNIETGRDAEKNKKELAMNYFRMALLKEGTFKDYFIDKAFSTLEVEWTAELEEKYLKKAEETEIIEKKR